MAKKTDYIIGVNGDISPSNHTELSFKEITNGLLNHKYSDFPLVQNLKHVLDSAKDYLKLISLNVSKRNATVSVTEEELGLDQEKPKPKLTTEEKIKQQQIMASKLPKPSPSK
jgi:hypothetical protein